MPRITGQYLLKRAFPLKPLNFSATEVVRTHNLVVDICQHTLDKIGGPQLLPHKVEVLSQPDFVKAFEANSGVVVSPEDASKLSAFASQWVSQGSLSQVVFYNVDNIRSQTYVGRTMVHEIMANLYGSFYQRVYGNLFELGIAPDIKLGDMVFNMIGEGWASYFSQYPFRAEQLFAVERDVIELRKGKQFDPNLTAYLETMSNNIHFFIALALTKIEMAYGLPTIVELMHKPPGSALYNNDDHALLDLLPRFWFAYREANQHLGHTWMGYKIMRDGLQNGDIRIGLPNTYHGMG